MMPSEIMKMRGALNSRFECTGDCKNCHAEEICDMNIFDKKEISTKWKKTIRNAKETLKWFYDPLLSEFITPDQIEALLEAGLKREPFEFLFIDPKEAIHRMEQEIELKKHQLIEFKKASGLNFKL